MTHGAILAIDQGTSSTKALVIRADGTIASAAEAAVHPRYPGPNAVEQDPEELWHSVLAASQRALAGAGCPVGAVALANQGETVLAWDRGTGRPLSPAIGWQDRRAEAVCQRLRVNETLVEQLSGLRLDSYFAAPKMTWLRESGYRAGVVTTSDSWLLFRLTGAYVTDAATASRTALLDLGSVAWSPELAAVFGLDIADLPAVVPCTAVVGSTTAFGAEVPVAGIAVDQQAALFAEGCHRPGEAKCTYGTGAFLLANTGHTPQRSTSGLVTCVAWQLGDAGAPGETAYCLDGQVYTVGSAVNWLRSLGILGSAADLDELAAGRPAGPEVFVPALAGLAAPAWAPGARGALTGLSLATDRNAIARAVVEGLAASVAVLARAAAADLGSPISLLRADGGLTRSRALMRAQADLLQAPVEVYATPHATALGVAGLARLGLGWADGTAAAVGFEGLGSSATYVPECPAEEAARRLARWQRTLDAVLALEAPARP
jgi:glycerol kinase